MAKLGAINYEEFRMLLRGVRGNEVEFFNNVVELVERVRMYERQVERDEDTTRDDWSEIKTEGFGSFLEDIPESLVKVKEKRREWNAGYPPQDS